MSVNNIDQVNIENTVNSICNKIKNVCLDEDICNMMRELLYIFYHSMDGIYVVDKDGISLRANPAFESLTGVKADKLLNRNVRELVAEGFFSSSVAAEVLRTKRPVTIVQEYKNGKKALVTGNPIFDEKGDVIKVISNIRDITELTKLYDELSANKLLLENYSKIIDNMNQLEINGIIAKSRSMLETVEMASRVAMTDSNVLLLGESGVGKGVFSKLIYHLSDRNKKPFITVNCSAIPESLLESELFGYTQGAFTGANREGKVGLVEAADRGVLFLDEISELPFILQPKILDFLETLEYSKVGSTKRKKVDVRVIAASNKDLLELVEKGLFREDLYYRLNVVPITIPSLRKRKDDIPLLINHFCYLINNLNFAHQ